MIDPDALVWAFCGSPVTLNLNTEVRVAWGTSDRMSASSIELGSADGDLHSVYHLDWRRCRQS